MLKSPLTFSMTSSEPTPLPLRPCWFYNKGEVPYSEAWAWQQALVEQRRIDPSLPDVLILLEHPPVYTLGNGSHLEFLKFDPANSDSEVYRVERGGEVTYHAPGQVVGYPILNLHYHRQDLHWYLRQLEAVILQVLAKYGLHGDRIPGLSGVWLEGYKVAAVGIKVSRWITMHGFALNVCPDLAGFKQIVPCGIRDRPVGNLTQFISDINPTEVRQKLATAFAEVFHVELVNRSA